MYTKKRRQTELMKASFGEIQFFAITGTVLEMDRKTIKVRSDNCDYMVRLVGEPADDFTGCHIAVWGHPSDKGFVADHYHVFTPEGERIRAR